jgi:hypothetical protein
VKPGLWPRDSLRNLEQTSVTRVLLYPLCDLRCYVPYSVEDGISAKWMSKGAYLNEWLMEGL